jgi:hypothetical protein
MPVRKLRLSKRGKNRVNIRKSVKTNKKNKTPPE